jgi:glycosyltransferase involved in cell wall biosynthesis
LRILVISNLYPPESVGGQEQRCADVVTDLVKRDHSVAVLTSGKEKMANELPDGGGYLIWRSLQLQLSQGTWQTPTRFFLNSTTHRRINQESLYKANSLFQPDVIFVWGIWNLDKSIPFLAEQLCPGRVVYSLNDYWLLLPEAFVQYWQKKSGRTLMNVPKFALGKLAIKKLEKRPKHDLQLRNCICVSQFVCDRIRAEGYNLGNVQVIYSGVNPDLFFANSNRETSDHQEELIKFLFVGRLVVEKGVKTIVKALDGLPEKDKARIELTIVGDGSERNSIEKLVAKLDLKRSVSFTGRVDRSEIPAVMRQHHVLIFPSIWPEPFARTILEAMATGLPVIGTKSGGTSELLRDGETGFTFMPGDYEQLKELIQLLAKDRLLRLRLGSKGRELVATHYNFNRMVDEIENYLVDVIHGQSGN